jgi:hypothetical protein
VMEDDLRRAELATRERLAEALMGKRADDAITDQVLSIAPILGECTCDECRAQRETRIENYAKGFDIP